jgi:hypothetical protein
LSRINGTILRTHVNTKVQVRAHVGPHVIIKASTDSHLMAQRLRALGLDGARPVRWLSAPWYQAHLGEGVPAD